MYALQEVPAVIVYPTYSIVTIVLITLAASVLWKEHIRPQNAIAMAGILCAIVLMNLWFNIPFATMLMAAALSKIPDSTIEAARDAGAERFRILRQMILPLTYRDLFVAATFVFMSNISSFTTPYLMDGNNPQMMGISLYTQFNNGHYEKAAALSVIMFLFSVLSAAVYVYTNMKENEWEKGNG